MEDIADGNQSVFGEKSVDDYCKKVMSAMRSCQKSSAELQGWYHYSDYSGVQKTMTRVNHLLHNVLSKIYKHQDININMRGHKLQEQFDVLREGNDSLLERINSDVDEASGFRRNNDIEMFDATVRTIRAPTQEEAGRDMVLLASRNVQKPQMFFEQKVNNSAKEPFVPTLTEKPHNIKPLAILPCINQDGREFYQHPYEIELQQWSPAEFAFVAAEPIKPSFLPDTPLLFVDTQQSVDDMVEELRNLTEIAIDVEAHSFRSYLGLTCLLQISSRTKDYVIDALALRSKLRPLNEILANPKITKVLHGADFDILWLQRCCGLYIVNMFDTHQASIILELPHRSLAALLNKYCNIHANKMYQRADWRIRPLPDDFIAYARQDSHYLLYIYDILRNDLVNRGNELHNLISACYSRSTELCLQRFEKPYVGPDTYLHLYRRSRKLFNSRQLRAFNDIFLWRDKVAREQDESVEYVLPKHMMLQIAEVLPKEMQGILGCCNPIPIYVKTDQLTLHQILRHAREQPLTEVPVNVDHTNVAAEDEDIAQLLLSKHDLSMVEHSSSVGLPTLLNPHETLTGDLFTSNNVNVQIKKKSSLFGKKNLTRSVSKRPYHRTPDFQSPFERYLLYIKLQPQIALQQKERETMELESRERERLDSVKEHFLSLQKRSTPSKDNIDVEEQARIARLVAHVSTLRADCANQSEDQSSSLKKKKKKKRDPVFTREPMLDKIKAFRDKVKDESKSDTQANDNDECQQKKRNPEFTPESMVNRIRTFRDNVKDEDDGEKGGVQTVLASNEEESPKKKGKKRKSGQFDGSKKKVKAEEDSRLDVSSEVSQHLEEAEIEEDEGEEIEPFDYSTADYQIFKTQKPQRKQGKKGFKEKFKGGRKNHSHGSGSKSGTFKKGKK